MTQRLAEVGPDDLESDWGKDYSWWEMARKAEPKNERYFTTRMIVASHADGLVF